MESLRGCAGAWSPGFCPDLVPGAPLVLPAMGFSQEDAPTSKTSPWWCLEPFPRGQTLSFSLGGSSQDFG